MLLSSFAHIFSGQLGPDESVEVPESVSISLSSSVYNTDAQCSLHTRGHTQKKSLYPDRSFPLLILIEITILSNFSYGTATNNLQVISFSVVALISEDVSFSQLLDADF